MQEETREYQKVISYLSRMIAGGELAIGSRLPTERSLAETLSIGRNSTREALRMLEHTGVIVCKRGSGNYLTGNVSRPITEMVHMMLLLGQTDRKEICSFRRNMEKAVCRAILDQGTFSRWKEQAAVLLQKAQEQQPLDRQIELDRQFHFGSLRNVGVVKSICKQVQTAAYQCSNHGISATGGFISHGYSFFRNRVSFVN